MVRLTRRQWLSLPVELKPPVTNGRAVLMGEGQIIPVTFVKRLQDSHFPGGIDTTANGQ